MSKNLRTFLEAVYAFDAVVQRVDASAWSKPSPCDGWTAHDVVEHQCSVLNGVQLVASTGQMAKPTSPADSSDPVQCWNATRDALIETLDQPGVLAQQGPFWFGAETVDDMIGVVTWDAATHTWDLAVATGQDHCLSDALLQHCLDTVTPMSDMLVESARTADRVEVDSSAPLLDRYLGLVGRTA